MKYTFDIAAFWFVCLLVLVVAVCCCCLYGWFHMDCFFGGGRLSVCEDFLGGLVYVWTFQFEIMTSNKMFVLIIAEI